MIRTLPDTLRRARELVEPSLRDATAALHPEIRRVVDYHLGFTDAAGRPTTGGGGKALRPTLAILGAEAVGADAHVAVPGASAVELVHNFSLLHDDVMDADRERRHRPTAWVLYGVGQAICAGDALLTLALESLISSPSPMRLRAARSLAEATASMIGGQADDLAFESRPDVSYDDCLRMCERKTGALLSCSASIGAILAGAADDVVDALADYGMHLGLAFQATDDILGIWGRPEVTGKPVHGDLRQHKRTLPIVAALEADDGRLVRLLESNGELEPSELSRAADLIEMLGGRARTLAEAEHHLALATERVAGVELHPTVRAELTELARFVCTREH